MLSLGDAMDKRKSWLVNITSTDVKLWRQLFNGMAKLIG